MELPILVSNREGTISGWAPWHYQGERRIRKATSVRGGPPEQGASVECWSAEIFIPFALLEGLGGVPPAPGDRWRANLYRIDYDESPPAHWAWSPISEICYHLYEEFGTLVFI